MRHKHSDGPDTAVQENDHNTLIHKAEEELRCAQVLLGLNENLWSAVCLHCRRCAQAYLKALLLAHKAFCPRNGDGELSQLPKLIVPDFPQIEFLNSDIGWLSTRADDATEGDQPVIPEAEGRRAFDIALRIRRFCRERMDVDYCRNGSSSQYVDFLLTRKLAAQADERYAAVPGQSLVSADFIRARTSLQG